MFTQSSARNQEARIPLPGIILALGVGSVALYLFILVLSFQFHYGERHAQRPILAVLTLFALATLCYLLALFLLFRHRPHAEKEHRLLQLILVFALAFRVILFFSSPIQEIDYYRYLWDGQVCLQGISPFEYSPQEIDQVPSQSNAPKGARQLYRHVQQFPTVATIFRRVHHRQVPTVYPPMAQVVFATVAFLTPTHASLWVHLGVLKALILAFDLGTLLVLMALLRRLGLPAVWCLAYGWCPLVIKEFANSAHLDSIAVFFTTLALYLLVCAWRGRQPDTLQEGSTQPRPTLFPLLLSAAGLTALGLGVLAKSYPVILLPVVGAYLFVPLRQRVVIPLACFVLVLALGYSPFLRFDGSPWPTPPSQSQVEPQSTHHPFSGLGTFLARWQMNDLLFMVVHENLRAPEEGQSDHWFVLIPRSWRNAWHGGNSQASSSLQPPTQVDPAFLWTQGIMGTILLGLCLSWAYGVYRQAEPRILLRAAFLTLIWGWLLSSAQNPWYLVWALPLMLFDNRRSWFLLPGLALIYYLRFYLEYSALNDRELQVQLLHTFDFGIVWWEFLPFLILLGLETWWRSSGRCSGLGC